MGHLFPPTNLPVEILQEVFFQCLPKQPNISAHPGFWRQESLSSPSYAPLLLCHVCRKWRAVALSSPHLWTTMSVIVRLGVAVPAPDLVSVWLRRSGALPLNLALYQQNESTANRVAAGHILDLFKRHISQWGDIHFELFGPHYSCSLIPSERARPLLREFRLYTSHLFPEQEKDLFSVLNHAPQLESLHVSRIPDLDLFGGSPIPIPWVQLVHLSLDYVPAVGTALHILNTCPNLKHCSMKIDTARGSLLYPPPHLPKLHTLSINLGFESLSCFLEQLTLPKLVDLTVFVRGPLEQYGWAQEQFDAFLTRSNCHIRRLEIHDTGMSSSQFMGCLQHANLQELVELVIDDTRDWTWDPFVTHDALDLLILPASPVKRPVHELKDIMSHGTHSTNTSSDDGLASQTPGLLPLLERLTIRGNCLLSSDGKIADMVESRWRQHDKDIARLNFVEVELLASHMEDMRRLKELQGEGLEVVLSQQY